MGAVGYRPHPVHHIVIPIVTSTADASKLGKHWALFLNHCEYSVDDGRRVLGTTVDDLTDGNADNFTSEQHRDCVLMTSRLDLECIFPVDVSAVQTCSRVDDVTESPLPRYLCLSLPRSVYRNRTSPYSPAISHYRMAYIPSSERYMLE
jgi:hypothetical protein